MRYNDIKGCGDTAFVQEEVKQIILDFLEAKLSGHEGTSIQNFMDPGTKGLAE
jgi:hypothetical protein